MFSGQLSIAVSESVQAVVLRLALLALTASVIIIAAGLQRRRGLLARAQARGAHDQPAWSQAPGEPGIIDVASEMRGVLRQLDRVAAQNLVEFELAVQPGLALSADRRVFRDVITRVVVRAIDQAPGGTVLLGAARQGASILITVSDEGTGSDRFMQEAALRPAERMVALQGGTFEIDARAGQGTTVMFRMAAARTDRHGTAAAEPTDPASIWARAHASRQTTTAVQ